MVYLAMMSEIQASAAAKEEGSFLRGEYCAGRVGGGNGSNIEDGLETGRRRARDYGADPQRVEGETETGREEGGGRKEREFEKGRGREGGVRKKSR